MAQPFTGRKRSLAGRKANANGGFLVVAFKNKTKALLLIGFVLGRNSWGVDFPFCYQLQLTLSYQYLRLNIEMGWQEGISL